MGSIVLPTKDYPSSNGRQGNQENTKRVRYAQAEYLSALVARDRRPLRGLAELGRRVAQELGLAASEFSHQALSKWLRGISNPSPEHREVLAAILNVPLDEVNRGCDGPRKLLQLNGMFRCVQVIVPNGIEEFRYPNLTIRTQINLGRPAIYRHWFEMFDPKPGLMAHHFLKPEFQALGWIPDGSAFPAVPYSRAMVPLCTERLTLVDRHSINKQLWFIYLPDGTIDCGFAWKERNVLILAKPSTGQAKQYPIGRTDLIGYAVGRTAFRLEYAERTSAQAS